MVRSRALVAVFVAAVFASGAAFAAPHRRGATAPKPSAAAPDSGDGDSLPPPPTSTHSEGDYGGVSPEHPGKPDPAQKPKRPPSKGTLSWIGFSAKDGGAEVFFQSVAAFELAQHVEGSALVIELPLARLGQNTWRDVDTRFFDSPIAHIVARHVGAAHATKTAPPHGAGIEIRVAFKNAKDAHEAAVRTATEADGMYYAYLSFGGGPAAVGSSLAEPEK